MVEARTVVPFGELGLCFFRYPVGTGEIYFSMIHGRYNFPFPVKNGKICKTNANGPNIWPEEQVEIIPCSQMVEHGLKINEGDIWSD